MSFLDTTARLAHFFHAHGIELPRVRLTFRNVNDAHRALHAIQDEFKEWVYNPRVEPLLEGDIHIHGVRFVIEPLK